MSLFLVLLGVCFSAGTPIQDAPLKTITKGQIVENVRSASAPDQRFTLYIPTTYDPSRPAAVLYLMDPRGRARIPAKLFRPAAERFGYILVSSHNSTSDRDTQPNLAALKAMWTDSHDWFSIDDRRVYVAGLSGTARTASLVALRQPGTLTGFIGAGAGFHPDARPSKATKVLYFGTAGDVDYNFHELARLEDSLASLDLPHRIEHFAGPHSWMPPQLATDAIEWLELRAMQSGARVRDEALISTSWERDSAAARAHMDGGRPLDAARRYAAMARDYAGLRPTDDVAAEAGRLSGSPAAVRQLKARQAAIKRSNQWAQNAMQAITESFAPGTEKPVRPALELAAELEFSKLKKQAAGPDPEAALEARRRLNQMEVQLGFYLPNDAIERADFERAAYYLSLAVQIDSASPVSWYLTAETHAHMREPRQALAALTRAVEVGFRDLASLETAPAFRQLRSDPRFTAIVESLRTSGDTLDPLTIDRPPLRLR
jgi:hypothetical protein